MEVQEVFVGKKLNDLHHMFKKVIKKEMDKLNLPNGYAFILKYLTMNESKQINQKDVVEYAKCKPSTISTTLQNMENDGLIKRKKEKDDNRKINVIITEKGREYALKMDHIFEHIEEMFNIALGECKTYFTRGIDKLYEVLEKEGGFNG